MTNIIEFPDEKDFKYTSYTDLDGDLGVCNKDRLIAISVLNKDEFLIGKDIINRKALAEFLWIAATFVDSDKKYFPDMDLIGCDY